MVRAPPAQAGMRGDVAHALAVQPDLAVLGAQSVEVLPSGACRHFLRPPALALGRTVGQRRAEDNDDAARVTPEPISGHGDRRYPPATQYPPAHDMGETPAMPSDPFVAPAALSSLGSIRYLDMRDQAAFDAGHAPGAVRVPLDAWDAAIKWGDTGFEKSAFWDDAIGSLGVGPSVRPWLMMPAR